MNQSDTTLRSANMSPAATGSGSRILDEMAKGTNMSVIRLVETLVQCASSARASDIHLDPGTDGVAVRIRVDGVLQEECVLPRSIHNEVIARLKILCSKQSNQPYLEKGY